MKWLFKGSLVVFLLISLVLLQGCPECLPPNPDNSSVDSDIIFTGSALNSQFSGVFIVREDGVNLQELLEEAKIYSGISSDGKFVYLTKSSSGNDRIVKYDFSRGKFEYPIDDTTYPVIKYPVRSKDGKYICFFTDNDQIISGENGVWFSAKFEVCPKTLPVFSPDSKYIAFYEGDSLEAPLKINIVRASNPGDLVNSKELSFGIKGMPGEAKLDWSHQDLISYSYTKSQSLDIIGVWNLDNSAKSVEYQLKENLGAFNPIISPDRTKILFTARDGNLWWRNYTEDTSSPAFWVDIGRVNENEYIAYPKFTKDGKKILYTRFFKNEKDIYSGKLEVLIYVGTDSAESKQICDRVNRAFWREK